jgi:hypothetical protein
LLRSKWAGGKARAGVAGVTGVAGVAEWEKIEFIEKYLQHCIDLL